MTKTQIKQKLNKENKQIAAEIDEIVIEQENKMCDWIMTFNEYIDTVLMTTPGNVNADVAINVASRLADKRQEAITERFSDAWKGSHDIEAD